MNDIPWKIIDSGICTAEENMNCDSALLESLSPSDPTPILHLYDWNCPSLTYGYFTRPEKFLNLNKVQHNQISMAKRPTGGGIILHMYDLAFSMIIPATHPAYSTNTLQNYHFINSLVISVIKRFSRTLSPELLPTESLPCTSACMNFCMAKPTQYDVMVDGKKIGGAAQRRTKKGFLHQGSIALTYPSPECKDYFLDKLIFNAMMENTFPLLQSSYSSKGTASARMHLKELFQDELSVY